MFTTNTTSSGGTTGDIRSCRARPEFRPPDLRHGRHRWDFRIAKNTAGATTDIMIITDSGYVGIGTTTPAEPLHVSESVAGLTFPVRIDNPYGDTSGYGPAIQFNTGSGGTARYKGAIAYTYGSNLSWNRGDFHILQNSAADSTNPTLADAVVTVSNLYGRLGVGDTTPDAKLDVRQAGATVAIFDRATNDGRIIEFDRDGVFQGSISVTSGNVSYNAFTGSHYATTSSSIKMGRLVRMTGVNRHLGGDADLEVIYGIAETTQENDLAVLGSMLGLQESTQAHGDENPYLVMAVGNGDMWVVDEGKNIRPGDLLISSAAVGHARNDSGTHPVANVVARAAGVIDWANVREKADNGKKHS